LIYEDSLRAFETLSKYRCRQQGQHDGYNYPFHNKSQIRITLYGFSYASHIDEVSAGTGALCDDPHTAGSLINIIAVSKLSATLMNQYRTIAVSSITALAGFSQPLNLRTGRITFAESNARFIGSTTQAVMGNSST
jgi:hypothetical protein